MVDCIVSVILDKLVQILINEGRQLLLFDDQFDETTKELRYMRSYLKDVDRVKRKDRNETLKTIMSDLRELVYDVEDIIADCQLPIQLKHQRCAPNLTSFFSRTLLKFHRRMGKRLRQTNKEIKEVKERMKSYLDSASRHAVEKKDGLNFSLSYPIYIDETEMVGLEDESAEIKSWIFEGNDPSPVIAIVGMGGIGKTALAQKICNNESVKNSFTNLVFVTVSQSFKLDELVKKMLRKLNVADESITGKDVEELLEKLKNALHEKYLIVLDDVWGTDAEMWWDSLKSHLPRVKGSCVVVTTRNEGVAKAMGAVDEYIHRPKILSAEDSWSLFSKVAFARNEGRCPSPDLEGFGKDIVMRCAGLPLAIKIVGGMMLGKGYSIPEWRRISEHLKGELETTKKDELILSSLELSYDELPMHLKPCLLWLAMYPEDFEISIHETIYGLIGEGFICGRNGKTAIETGKECFEELLNRCLILRTSHSRNHSRKESLLVTCTMHDVVRDMVIKIARDENFLSLDSEGSPVFTVQSRRVGIFESTAAVASMRMGNSCKLRTLVMKKIESKDIISFIKTNLCRFRWLRVLHLSFSTKTRIDKVDEAKEWLSAIGSLPHLIHLHIENASALITLPNSIRNLHNLRILHLQGCPNLERLPPSITTLEKLTTVRVINCDSFICMPEGLDKLSNLEELSGFRPANSRGNNGGCQITTELKNLTKLRELWMVINDEEKIEEGEWNLLSMFRQLKRLSIDYTSSSIGIERKINHQLSPPLQCLRELYLWNYPGERTQAWLSPTSLPNLHCLYIGTGRLRKMGPGFWGSTSEEEEEDAAGGVTDGGVWKLEVLVLFNLEEFKEDWVRMRRAMPSLRHAEIIHCLKFNSFPRNDDAPWQSRMWRKEHEKGIFYAALGAKDYHSFYPPAGLVIPKIEASSNRFGDVTQRFRDQTSCSEM